MKQHLTDREQKVLWATIEQYILTAEPVGSKALVSGYDFDISPATIRNVMNMLDRSGLLFQPHTSSGRVPSDSGYRVYVDELIDPASELTYSRHQFLASKSDRLGKSSLDGVMRDVAQILATLSGCIAVITAPNMQTMRIRHLQLVMVDDCKVMAIAVSDTYHTASVTMDLPSETKPEVLEGELNILNNFLNEHLRDKNWSELNSGLQWDDLDRQFQQYAVLLQQSLQQLMRLCDRTALGQMFISGLTELLRQPEFSNLRQVQNIVQLLEADRASLMALIIDQPTPSANSVSIRIGSEISIEPIQNCTFISSTYLCDDKPVGTVGVLGPTRLGYTRAIASVQAAALHLTDAISKW
ncbi:MAG: heat-inducible transcriptional repressor HrcA [Pseudanabaena sp.]|jgi:heat-inducible transcriptional repressor|nr:heat-inducible transcriptional repressor HrcA [Pseudanabaena sp. M090S1SP2A07QC]MCA6507202.1 heat-inducible transcriptional repressor HrcA [Pseudanabaena sp. M172S2SP2A07QC]MCA6508917.1 heat-inducible transcriptional repressor HrcA [Pseudanabaena sp. M109S1SP2A07QC]MCA6523430.1 heat-inducible transcriptional repressor HrcA [Pseudanabaena sp. M051S1SP2A07QC]MCA6526339.1 heat-inducible transcriptional repressor HrcA [Pseudanabaena sp. M179S2SP2A07QC]MCA6532371.1 heat-inducible transcriptional